MPKVLVLQSCFYPGADGAHVLLEADAEADVPASVAHELAQCGRVLYVEPADVPDALSKAVKRVTVSEIIKRGVRDRAAYRQQLRTDRSSGVL